MIIKYINKNLNTLSLKQFDKENFNIMSKMYSFTTENISGYFPYIDFNKKDVITVVGSGDHILNAIYSGAEKVLGYDINYLSLIFAELKLVALKYLSYKEFFSFFMINDELDSVKNEKVLNYEVYKTRLRQKLNDKTIKSWDKIFYHFRNNGYELRNSYMFNNKYDSNMIKIKSNIYLKNEKEFNIAKENLNGKTIYFLQSNFTSLNIEDLQKLNNCDIILMSNISDYIKIQYANNYLETYIKEIISNLKYNNQIVCAYLYDSNNSNYRSEIDNPNIRKKVFKKLKIKYIEKKFESVIPNCTDKVIII